jgi:hypothetical protein
MQLEPENTAYVDDSMDVDLSLIRFDLPPPRPLSDFERAKLVVRVRERLYPNAVKQESSDMDEDVEELKSLLVIRMVTRGFETGNTADEAEKQLSSASVETVRQAMCDYVVKDFSSRCVLG